MNTDKKMMIVTEINTKQEFDDMKEIMEIFALTGRIKKIAEQN